MMLHISWAVIAVLILLLVGLACVADLLLYVSVLGGMGIRSFCGDLGGSVASFVCM